jgi:hypothetical protein
MVDAVDIVYGRLAIKVERSTVETMRSQVASIPPEERDQLMQSIDRALRKNILKIAAGQYEKRLCDTTASDLVIWHILRGN